jgi:hypothetical protein
MALKNGHDNPNVTSLDAARKRAAQKARLARAANDDRPERTARDWLIGGILLLMAVGFLIWLGLSFAGMAP